MRRIPNDDEKTEMMDTTNLRYSEIPEHFCVIRIKNTCNYLHCKEDFFYFKEKMHGCFVCLPEVSENIYNDLKLTSKSFDNLEIIKFHEAYKQHGLIEKQISYN